MATLPITNTTNVAPGNSNTTNVAPGNSSTTSPPLAHGTGDDEGQGGGPVDEDSPEEPGTGIHRKRPYKESGQPRRRRRNRRFGSRFGAGYRRPNVS